MVIRKMYPYQIVPTRLGSSQIRPLCFVRAQFTPRNLTSHHRIRRRSESCFLTCITIVNLSVKKKKKDMVKLMIKSVIN